MLYQRMLNKSEKPSETEMESVIGNRVDIWRELRFYLRDNYNFTPEINFFTKKYGWSIRYRRSGKTLCALFPEEGAFSVLLVLGQKEAEKVNSLKDDIDPGIWDSFNTTEHFHDGRWIWFRILNREELTSLIKLINIKRKPVKK